MEDAERLRLLGKYRTPRFRIGRKVLCEVRGEMVITGMTDAPILWPVGRNGPGRQSLIVYKGLAPSPDSAAGAAGLTVCRARA